MRQKVVNVIPEGGSLFEVSTPFGVWGHDRTADAGLDIDFVRCGVDSRKVHIDGGLEVSGLEVLSEHVADADVVVVPTWPVTTTPVPSSLIESLAEAHAAGARLVGLCLGAFPIATTGLLDGQGAVTHWRFRERFESSFPEVTFEPDTLYVDLGQVVTSAGSASALDCCLHLIRRDHSAEAAASIARSLVTAPHRSAAQSQFAAAPPIEAGPDPVGQALAAAAERIETIASVDDLAALANVSRRTLERRVRDRHGVSPKEWIAEQRVIAACRLLEQAELTIEEVAHRAGYGSTPSLRRALSTRRSTTPTLYRSMFVAAAAKQRDR